MGVFKPALDAHWKPYLDGKTHARRGARSGCLKSVATITRAEHQDRGQRQQAGGEAAGRFANPSHQVRADEAADVADRVHQRNAAGGGGAAQQRGRHAPRTVRAFPRCRTPRSTAWSAQTPASPAPSTVSTKPAAPIRHGTGDVPAALARCDRNAMPTTTRPIVAATYGIADSRTTVAEPNPLTDCRICGRKKLMP